MSDQFQHPPTFVDNSETLTGEGPVAVGRIHGCDFLVGRGKVMVARLGAPIDPQQDSVPLAKYLDLDRLGAEGRVVLNLEHAPVVSALMGTLVSLHENCRRTGGRMALCGLSPAAEEYFRKTRLDQRFRILPTEDLAILSLVTER